MKVGKRLKVVVLDDHITPYRSPLFTRLAKQPSLDIIHLFTRKRLPDRQWEIPALLDFQHQFLPGILIRLKSRAYQDEQRHVVLNPTLFWTLIRHNPDIVVGYAFSVPTWMAFLYSKLAGKRFISWSTDTPLTRQHLSRIQKAIRQHIIPRADGCITPSRWGRAMFESYGAQPDHITIVPQAADTDTFMPSAPDQEVRAQLALSPSAKVMLYVGYVSERKGVRFLLEALPTIREAMPNTQMLIVGDGHLKNTLQDYATKYELTDYVRFAGYVKQRDLPAVYNSADVFVFPTLDDRFGVVVAEAAASGLPLVISQFAGSSFEFVRQGENGFIIDPKHRQELVDAIIHVLSEDDRRQQMAKLSRQIAEKKDLDYAASQFTQALHQVAQ